MNVRSYISLGLILLSLGLVIVFKGKRKELGTRKITLMGCLISLSLALGLLESSFGGFFVPGFNLGLGNAIILLALYGLGYKEAFIIDLCRVLLLSLCRGSFLSMGGWMSFAGAALSFIVMALGKAFFKHLSIVGVSLLGAIAHDIGQIGIALLYLNNKAVFYYLPFMVLVSLFTGVLIGLLVRALLKRKLFSISNPSISVK